MSHKFTAKFLNCLKKLEDPGRLEKREQLEVPAPPEELELELE